MSWLALRVRAPSAATGAARETLIAALFGAGAAGVQEDRDVVIAHFPPGAVEDELREVVTRVAPDADVDASAVAAVDWSEAWRHGIAAHELGRLVVTPPWLAADWPPERTVVIDPGMGFGTGEHATTRGVMRLMQEVIRSGDRVADLGAGSGVLSIAAARLGASRVAAIEMDPDAIGNAEENVERNGVGDVVTVIEGDAGVLLPLVSPVRVVLANIISSVLVALLPPIARALAPDGRAILSGILLDERADMLQVLDEQGWRVEREDREDIWWSATIARR